MRIAILTVGSRGDVQPGIALGVGLQRSGHEVVLAAHKDFEDLVTAEKLEFAIMPGGLNEEELESHENREELLRQRMRAVLDICDGAEAIAYTSLAFTAYHVAEKLGALPIRMLFVPEVMTGSFPSVHARVSRTYGSYHSRLSHAIEKLSHWAVLWRPMNRVRGEILDLPGIPLWGPDIRMRRERVPALLSASPALLPRPDDWPPWAQITGYWFLDSVSDWEPPEDLARFLAAGPPPVFLEAGGFTQDVWTRTMRTVVAVLVAAGRRVITAWQDESWADSEPPEGVFVMSHDTPHAWILPHTCAVVAHGGTGTTHAIARAGLPTMTIPIFPVQRFWAERLHAAGMAPPSLPIHRVTPEAVANRIDALFSDTSYAERAAEVGTAVRAERGVARAVQEIERAVASRAEH